MLKSYKKYLFLFALIFLFLTVSHAVFALENTYPAIPFGGGPLTNDSTLPDIIKYFFGLSIALAGIIGVLSIVIAGITMLISAGNPGAVGAARERIFGSILGIILLMFSVTLLSTINPALIGPNQPALVSTMPIGPVLITGIIGG